jgi:hypothetical protein
MPEKTESKPVSEEELREESNIEEEVHKEEKSFRDKDGTGYGDLMSTNVMPYNVNEDSETYVGLPAQTTKKTYIPQPQKKGMADLNKITHTRVGDYINYYQNGVEDSGVIAKMSGSFITVFKEDGKFYDVHINDTFFVRDILVNKTWNDMSMEERTEELTKVKAYSPRYLSKTWEQLPRELQDVLKIKDGALPKKGGKDLPQDYAGQAVHAKNRNITSEKQLKEYDNYDNKHGLIARTEQSRGNSLTSRLRHQGSTRPNGMNHFDEDNTKELPPTGKAPQIKTASDQEHGAYGTIGGSSNVAVSTDTPIDASEDYEGASHTDMNIANQFQHDSTKPETTKHKKKAGEFVYSDNPNTYKIPQTKTKGWGMKYGVKYINSEEEE